MNNASLANYDPSNKQQPFFVKAGGKPDVSSKYLLLLHANLRLITWARNAAKKDSLLC